MGTRPSRSLEMMRIAIHICFYTVYNFSLIFLQPRPIPFFGPDPIVLRILTQLPSRPLHAPICSVMEEAEEEDGRESELKTLRF